MENEPVREARLPRASPAQIVKEYVPGLSYVRFRYHSSLALRFIVRFTSRDGPAMCAATVVTAVSSVTRALRFTKPPGVWRGGAAANDATVGGVLSEAFVTHVPRIEGL